MNFLLRLGGWLWLLAGVITASAQTSLQIYRIDIRHIGPPAASDEFIRANIRVKPGDPYLRFALDDDVQNLYKTGLFHDIRVGDEITTNGVILTYVLQGKPRLTEIKFQGNVKYNDAKLRKKLTSKVGEPFNEQKLFTDRQEIEKMYQKAGYPGTTVNYIPNIDNEAGRASVTFEINEGHKVRIEDIEFVGAQAFTLKQLRKALKTKRHNWLSWITSSGVFKEEQFEDD